ncbi:rust resistance kinase Lr10-like [Vigna radiata var. radiata]|uniref:Rust resistance kinase Lr10-like n=1 Tax=Vigna radiata var. radiata TaxID=3916 RepID=A0A1S3VTU4_VIGRR|nr:rust resistance kinase Lr10-like [Vigna radiata var. radiata]
MAKSSTLSLHGYGILITLMLFHKLIPIKGSSYHDECGELSCGPNQPPIRFPFQLVKGIHECAHRGYCLYCTQENNTMLFLPTIKLQVENIDYENLQIYLKDPNNCLPKTLLNHFNSLNDYYFTVSSNLSFFDCSSVGYGQLRNTYAYDQDMISCPIYVTDSQASVLEWDLTFCSKMFDVTAPVSAFDIIQNQLKLTWSKPACTACEAQGKRCKWKNNSTEVIECLDCYDQRGLQKRITDFRSFIVSTTVIVGSVLLGLLVIAVFKSFRYFRKKEEDQARVDKFLEDYRAEKPTRFTYADVKRITGGFKEKLGEGAHGAVFRGKLSNEILVAVKIINNSDGDGNEFINEVGIMGKIHHINVIRLLGFCAEGIHRALVYNLFPKGSLQSFIFPPDDKDHFLGWEKMQHIALGIAKGIEYLHQGCNNPIVHFDINPRNVLLDDNFTPKISDFGLAKLCSKNPSLVSMTAARGTLGYIAPEVFSRNFGNVSYKSDIYSYGMLLLEMVGGRKNVDMSSPQNVHVLYPDWIHNLVDGDIHIQVEDEDHFKIAKKLAIVGLWCIQWQPVNRPSMKSVIQMLETKEVIQLTVPPNPFHSTTSTTASLTSARRPLELEAIQE